MADSVSPPLSLPLGRDSVTYRLSLEPVMVLAGGPRALLLQVAHPVVGAGVADHSDYATNPWPRLIRTLQVMTQLSLGPDGRSEEMRRLLRKSHATINGTMPDGGAYRALDADNMLWVWATLLDTLVEVHATFIGGLADAECERLYREWVLIAEACGVPRDRCPADWDAFVAYVADTIADGLVPNETAATVGSMLAHPPLPFPLGAVAATVLGRTVPGQLPPSLRNALGMAWSRGDQARFDAVARLSRTASWLVPGRLRRLPGAIGLEVAFRLPAPRMRRRLRAVAAA